MREKRHPISSGDSGIRTTLPLRTTAFRVRLVMTTSICLEQLYYISHSPAGQVEILLFCPARLPEPCCLLQPPVHLYSIHERSVYHAVPVSEIM